MFLTDSDFRTALAGALKVDAADLAKYWDLQCQQAHESAYLDIRGALLVRGFTATQVDLWDRGGEFERDIGIFWACVRGLASAALDPVALDRLDRRAELMTVLVEVAGGAPQEPAATPGRIVAGMFSTTDVNGDDDVWTRDTEL